MSYIIHTNDKIKNGIVKKYAHKRHESLETYQRFEFWLCKCRSTIHVHDIREIDNIDLDFMITHSATFDSPYKKLEIYEDHMDTDEQEEIFLGTMIDAITELISEEMQKIGEDLGLKHFKYDNRL